MFDLSLSYPDDNDGRATLYFHHRVELHIAWMGGRHEQ